MRKRIRWGLTTIMLVIIATFSSRAIDSGLWTLFEDHVGWYNARRSGSAYNGITLQKAITDVATWHRGIYLQKNPAEDITYWDLASDITVPQHIPLQIPFGVRLRPANGVTLTLDTCPIAGEYQVIDLSAEGGVRYNNCGKFNVLWTGADPTGVNDSTGAFNAATQHTRNWSEGPFQTEIHVPGGKYSIKGTVFIRAGQHMRGAGYGATKIIGPTPEESKGDLFYLGAGLINGVISGEGTGIPPHISGLHINPGPVGNFAAVHSEFPGVLIESLFLTNCDIGVHVRGSDAVISNIQSDQNLTGFFFENAQSIVMNNINIYLGNFGIRFGVGVSDILISNLLTEYTKYSHVSFDDGSTARNVRIHNWTAILNEQYSTFLGFVHTRAAEMELHINGFSFRNMKSWAVQNATGINARMTFANGIFDGNKTRDAYTQSTDAAGISGSNADISLYNVEFRNLAGQPIQIAGTFPSQFVWSGGRVVNCTPNEAISLSNSNNGSIVRLANIRGQLGVGKRLYNAQQVFPVIHEGRLTDWFGSAVDSGIRWYVLLPYQGSTTYEVTILANVSPSSNTLYRKQSTFLVSKQNGYSGSAATSYIDANEIHMSSATNILGILDVNFEFNAIGGGTSLTPWTHSGYIAVSVPNTYNDLSFFVRQVGTSAFP